MDGLAVITSKYNMSKEFDSLIKSTFNTQIAQYSVPISTLELKSTLNLTTHFTIHNN